MISSSTNYTSSIVVPYKSNSGSQTMAGIPCNPVPAFRDAMHSAGIAYDGKIIADGKIHRFRVNGDKSGSLNGWLVLHNDNLPVGLFGSWKTGLTEKWCAKPETTLTPAERETINRRMEDARRKRDAELQQVRETARSKANKIWSSVSENGAAEHQYIKRKGINAYGVKVRNKSLIVPLRDNAGQLHSLQFISQDGEKRFLLGGATSGHYHLITKGNNSTVYICEGYATAASIHQATSMTVVAAFNSGNLLPVAKAIRERLQGSNLVIAADSDKWTEGNPGMTKATQAANAIGGSVVYPKFKDTSTKPTDFNDLLLLDGVAEVKRQTDIEQQPDEGPQPLRRKPTPAEDFPVNALGEILGNAARSIHQTVKAPIAVCCQSILAATGLAVQGSADVVIDGRRILLSAFFALVAKSGERKSAVDAVALAPHRERENELQIAHSEKKKEYKLACDVYESARKRIMNSNKSQAAKMYEIAALDEPPPRPLEPVMLVTEPTYEGLFKLLQTGQPSVGLFTDEGGRFVGGHAMNSDNALKTAAGLSELKDRGRADRIRSGDGSSSVRGRRVAIHLMLQPVVAEQLFSNEVLAGQGFLNRFLICWPESTIGLRQYHAYDLTACPAMIEYNTFIKSFLTTPPSLREGAQNELKPRTLTLSPDAKSLWVRFHNSVDEESATGGKLYEIQGIASKMPENAICLAGILTLSFHPTSGQIDRQSMEGAIRICDFYLGEALRIYEAGITDPDILQAEKLLAWLHGADENNMQKPPSERRPPYEFVYSGLIQQYGPGGIRTAKQVESIMGILVDHGWAVALDSGTMVDGKRRKKAWKIVYA